MRAERPQPLPDAAIDAARAIRRGLLTSEALTRACIAAMIAALALSRAQMMNGKPNFAL